MVKVIIPVSPIGILSAYGYKSTLGQRRRRSILTRIMEERVEPNGRDSYAAIISRLNATAIRFKNRRPDITRNIRDDMAYLKRKYRRKTL